MHLPWAAPNFSAGFAADGEPAKLSRREARRKIQAAHHEQAAHYE